ncbi:Helicase associated domain protein [Streptomyces sp. DR7-3]|uniref:helicase associated domain-containing protein n=1 Tax=Streptomyces malaysiensis TaxID=92644 RepID=UPI0020449E82|nr:DEAD/DEAH box helicase [Streptomyces sp. DR7-3]MCM3812878.1 Helicase associated domain protein [Streptomyces sp. DR7-3]
MTFHQRVEEAAAFAEKLPETAAELYATDASEQALSEAGRLPESSIDAEFYELEAGRHVPPDRVWSTWLCGDHLVAERREAIRQFANGLDASGRRAHRAFLASVRVLGQGIDIVGTRGVEAVCFADTRGSQVEIVQNIGRALRPNPDGSTKVARIIVPVFLEPGENPEDMVASASFRPLVAVLQGLRSHSEQLVEQLASHALTRSHQQRRVHIHRDAQGRIVRVGGQGEGGGEGLEDGEGADGTAESALLYFSSPRDPATIAAFLRTRVYRPESLVWLEGYQARRRWREENGITGLHPTPYDTETSTDGGRFPVGRWEAQQRRAARTGDLDAWRRELLDEDGMVWEPGEEAWETKLALFRSYHRAHGHLAPRQDAPWGETDTDTQPIGQQVANIRRKNGLGKNPERAETRAAQLTAIDPDWNCPWPLDWQRHYRILAQLAEDEPDGHLPDIAPGVLLEGDDLGKWLRQQANNWTSLSNEQQQRLTALGMTPAERPAPAANSGRKTAENLSAAFQRGVAALAQYIAREGHHRIPRSHIEEITVNRHNTPVSVRLGVFMSNTKSRRDKLTTAQRAALAELGVEWA